MIKNVGSFKIPDENAKVETPTEDVTTKSVPEKQQSKPKKIAKSTKKPKSAMSAMEAAMMDMGIDPYNPGDEIVEEPDRYGYDIGW